MVELPVVVRDEGRVIGLGVLSAASYRARNLPWWRKQSQVRYEFLAWSWRDAGDPRLAHGEIE